MTKRSLPPIVTLATVRQSRVGEGMAARGDICRRRPVPGQQIHPSPRVSRGQVPAPPSGEVLIPVVQQQACRSSPGSARILVNRHPLLLEPHLRHTAGQRSGPPRYWGPLLNERNPLVHERKIGAAVLFGLLGAFAGVVFGGLVGVGLRTLLVRLRWFLSTNDEYAGLLVLVWGFLGAVAGGLVGAAIGAIVGWRRAIDGSRSTDRYGST